MPLLDRTRPQELTSQQLAIHRTSQGQKAWPEAIHRCIRAILSTSQTYLKLIATGKVVDSRPVLMSLLVRDAGAVVFESRLACTAVMESSNCFAKSTWRKQHCSGHTGQEYCVDEIYDYVFYPSARNRTPIQSNRAYSSRAAN